MLPTLAECTTGNHEAARLSPLPQRVLALHGAPAPKTDFERITPNTT